MSAPTKKQQESGRVRRLDYKSKKKAVRYSEPIAGSFRLFARSIKHLWLNKRIFLWLLLVYGVLYMLFVKGLATNFQLGETRTQLEEAAGSELGALEMGAILFGTLVGVSGSVPSDSAAVYQTVLFVVLSLAVIWTLRQTYQSPKKLKVSTVFYSSMSPLVPYVLTWLVVLLQLIPALTGIFLYSIVVANGIAVGWVEQVLWLVLLFAFIGVSIFMISSSLFATYIAALPDMRPMVALKKAKSLVKFRRFLIIRKLVFLPFILIVLLGLVFFPLVLYAAVVAEVLFLIVSLLLLFILHTYVYMLYREML